MENINWNDVQEQVEFPTPGAYAAKITAVEDNTARQYLMVNYEIVQGNYKGYCQDTYDRMGFWPFRSVWSYKQKALWFFKQKKMAVEASNSGFTFTNDPQSLVGKYCAIVVGEEEYVQKSTNKVKTRLYVADVISGEKYKKGDYQVPELKKLEPSTPAYEAPQQSAPAADFGMIEDDDTGLPF